MNLLKFLMILLTCFFLYTSGSAQYDNPGETTGEQKKDSSHKRDPDSKLFFSPRFGLSFRSTEIYLEAAPVVGYKIIPRFWLGAGPEYIYYQSGSYRTSIYGATSFAYFAILDNIQEVTNLGIGSVFLYLENEILSIQPYEKDRAWYDIVLGGMGIRIPIGSRMGISIIAMWGLNKSAELLYSNPEIRIMYDF
jgi:hypothetical protein